VRNAAKHACGEDSGRKVVLAVRLQQIHGRLRLEIADDGVGPHAAGGRSGAGLRIHSALLAAAGGSLEVGPAPGGGTVGVILI
jgi:signal transduction histidine kinase